MAKIKTSQGSTKIDAGNNAKFALVEPGRYIAKVIDCVPETYKSRDKSMSYMALKVRVELYNAIGTLISHNITVGAINEDGVVYQPDDAKRKEGISGVWLPAQWFMAALGWTEVEEFDPDLVMNHVCVVSVYHREANVKQKDGDGNVLLNERGEPVIEVMKFNDIGFVRENGKIGAGFNQLLTKEYAAEIMGFNPNDPDTWSDELHEMCHLDYEGGMWFSDGLNLEMFKAKLEQGDEEDLQPGDFL